MTNASAPPAPPADFATYLLALAAAAPTALPADTLPKLRKHLENILRAEHKALDNTPWTNLSAAIGFVAYRRGLSAELKSALHRLRAAANQVLHESYAGTAADVSGGLAALALLHKWLTGEEVQGLSTMLVAAPVAPRTAEAAAHLAGLPGAVGTPTGVFAAASPALTAPERTPVGVPTIADLRVTILAFDKTTGHLLVEPDAATRQTPPDALRRWPAPWRVQLPEAYTKLTAWARLRPTLRLLDVRPEVRPDGAPGLLHPRRVVLEPDYLISVTTVAECMQSDGAVPELALIKAFMPDEATRAMVLGNLVNALLDEEVREAAHGRDLDFEQWVKKQLFKQSPLQISALSEFGDADGVRQLIDDLRRHHLTLRAVRTAGFVPLAQPGEGYQHVPLDVGRCFLEPAFISARYGLQGRLDLLHESDNGFDLIELKSSAKVPLAGTWENNRAQAVLYRLMLETVGAPAADGAPRRYRANILYSGALAAGAVRPVGRRDLEFEDALLMARNLLVARELALATCRTPAEIEHLLRPVLHPTQYKLPPYNRAKAETIADSFARADAVERAYALELIRFAARELRVCLLGDDARPGDVGGQAGLWALTDARKKQNFSLLDGLTLRHDASNDDTAPHLIFRRDPHGAEVNFRDGDSLLLYPRSRREAASPKLQAASTEKLETRNSKLNTLTALDSQVVKVSLESISPDEVRLSVRNRRIAPEYLARHATWALEPDCYDTFRREWAGVGALLGLPTGRRRLLMGRDAPAAPADWTPDAAPARDAQTVVARALAAPDWFLLCGPPGTGKTRAVLAALAKQLHADGQQLLLAAYTNRAVDEICEQLVHAGLPFIRLGSRLSTEEVYRPYLLDAKLAACRSRHDVKVVLGGCPIYVGTISSLIGKPELFQFKRFDVLVVDEASQILETPMLQLLSRVPKWILIGDHKQLPAVVTQAPESCAVAAPVADLLKKELNLTSLKNSYFERLFRLAEQRWPWAHGTLSTQYRLHEELTELVNIPFYDGVLTCGLPRQTAVFDRTAWPAATDALGARLLTERRLFLPTRRSPEDVSAKESREEARLAARLAGEIAVGYGADFRPADTVGIIASFRNQVALIRTELAAVAAALDLPALNEITVDTVERYQGSQREVIIVSFCCHFEHQLETLVSLDETGTVDRKLNVALTRAKEQLILLGNEEILGRDARYRAVIEQINGVAPTQ